MNFQDKVLRRTSADKIVSSTGKIMEDATSQIVNTTKSGAVLIKKNARSTVRRSSTFSLRKKTSIAPDDLSAEVSQTETSATHSPGNASNGVISSQPRASRRPSTSSLKSSLRSSARIALAASKINGSQVSFSAENETRSNSHSRIYLSATDKFPSNLPEQNIKAKKGDKKSKPIQEEISELQEKAKKATLNLFDDRVYIVDDGDDGEKTLKLYESMNPVVKLVNPLLGGVFKIVETNLNAFRAIFNILMWKDPALSFWATLFAVCCMYILFLIPWRIFFCVGGIVAVGPQNYFLADWFEERKATKKRKKAEKEKEKASSPPARSRPVNLSASPLLMRNNIQMKPDGRSRDIIVPSVPLRYNRFYDWPPDPSTTVITKLS